MRSYNERRVQPAVLSTRRSFGHREIVWLNDQLSIIKMLFKRKKSIDIWYCVSMHLIIKKINKTLLICLQIDFYVLEKLDHFSYLNFFYLVQKKTNCVHPFIWRLHLLILFNNVAQWGKWKHYDCIVILTIISVQIIQYMLCKYQYVGDM